MWPTFHINDFRTAIHYIGVLLILISLTMVVPLGVAVINQEWEPAFDYFLSCATGVFFGMLMRFAQIRPGDLTGKQAMLVTGLAWVFLSLVGAVPLYLSGHFNSFLDASFDAVSGLTTTGVSLIQDVDHIAYAHNVWRLITHIIGGQGIIAIAMTVGLFAKTSGAPSLYRAEGKEGDILPNVIASIRFSAIVTAAFTGVGTVVISVICALKGISSGRAIFHAFSLSAAAFGTGGFAPMSTSVIYYHSFALEVALMLIMMAGAMNFSLYFVILKGNTQELKKNAEVKALMIWAIFIVVLLSLSLARDPYFSNAPALLRRGIFTAIAAMSNAGFSDLYSSQFSAVMTQAALFILVLGMAVGGATGSTSGGIKAMRVVIIYKTIVANIKRAVAPDSAIINSTFHHLSERKIDSDLATNAMTIFLLYLMTYLLGSMVGVALGYSPMQSMFESVSVTSNAGLSSGIVSPDMPTTLKIVYILQMWAGRIEFFALFALIAGTVATITPESVKEAFAKRANN